MRDDRLADDVLLRLTQPQIRRQRQRRHQLSQPDPVFRARHVPHRMRVFCRAGQRPEHWEWALALLGSRFGRSGRYPRRGQVAEHEAVLGVVAAFRTLACGCQLLVGASVGLSIVDRCVRPVRRSTASCYARIPTRCGRDDRVLRPGP